MCEVAHHEPKYITSSLLGMPPAPPTSSVRSVDSSFSLFGDDGKDFSIVGPPPGLGAGAPSAGGGEVPDGPPPGLPDRAAGFDAGLMGFYEGMGMPPPTGSMAGAIAPLGLADAEPSVVTEVAEAVLLEDPSEQGLDPKKRPSHQRQRNAAKKMAAVQAAHVAPTGEGYEEQVYMHMVAAAQMQQLMWQEACGYAASAYAGIYGAAPAPPGTWSRTSSTATTAAPTSASPPPSPTSRSAGSSPAPAAGEAAAEEAADVGLPLLAEDLPSEAVVKESLTRFTDPATGAVVIEWVIKENRLRSLDKQAVSPSFKLRVAGQPPATFRVMITPAARSDGRGAGSFKQSKGRGRISVKCVEPPLGAEAMPLTMSLRIGEGPSGDPQRGPFTHDFIDRSCFEQQDTTWNFAGAVDARRAFAVQLLLQDVSPEE